MQTVFAAAKTKTAQVTEFLENEIRSGNIKAGDRLHGMRELGARFDVSTMVVNTAIGILEKKNLVERRSRQGIFVRNPEIAAKRFLMVNYPANSGKDSPYGYIIPEFESLCRVRNVAIDEIGAEFLRNGGTEAVRQLTERHYDGVLLAGSRYNGNEPEIAILKQLGVPVLVPHGHPGDDGAGGNKMHPGDAATTGFTVFSEDGSGAWYDALEHLIKRGYRRIGAIGIARSGYMRLRCGSLENHLEILHSLGGEVSDNSVLFLDYSDEEQCRAKLGQWLGDKPPFDAVMCYSDFFALRVYKYCAEHGIRIPNDLAVMGFCGFPGGQLLNPGLSTIDLGYSQIGREAADFLFESGKSRKDNSRKTSYQLVIRDSTRKS